MILQRLYELAVRKKLLADRAFEPNEIGCLLMLNRNGVPTIFDLRERKVLTSTRKAMSPKFELTGGRLLPVPVRPVVWDEASRKWKTTDPAASGKEKPAVFLVDTLARVLPVERLIKDKDREKNRAQRSTFWRFIQHAAKETGNEALVTLAAFADRLQTGELQEQLCVEVEKNGFTIADKCTFA